MRSGLASTLASLALATSVTMAGFGCGSPRPAGGSEPAAPPPTAAGQGAASTPKPTSNPEGPVIDFTVDKLEGGSQNLADYRGKVLLIVNTASECGYTPQFAGLEKIYQRYKDKGLVVLGFPSNDFGGQDPGSAEEIKTFCQRNYGVTFPMMAKVHAKGAEIAPIYKALTTQTGDGIKGDVKWNFTKFLVDKQGKVVARFEPAVTPESPELTSAIEKLL